MTTVDSGDRSSHIHKFFLPLYVINAKVLINNKRPRQVALQPPATVFSICYYSAKTLSEMSGLVNRGLCELALPFVAQN